jgi:hypothetical protein
VEVVAEPYRINIGHWQQQFYIRDAGNNDMNYNIVKYKVSSVKRDPTIEDSISVNLSTYFSIPYSHSPEYQLSGGATTIIYDSLGTNPKCVKTPYDL